jgi:hypothetical protein
MQNQSDFIVKLIVDAWYVQVSRVDKLLEEMNDEQLQQQIAPGKNSGVYLIGHLAAIHDAILPLLNLGQRLHPELEEVFVNNPDSSGLPKPPVSQLRIYWKEINDHLASHFQKMNMEDWLQRHEAISASDFISQPHRNKLNVLLNRTSHLANHLGQMLLLLKKEG